jgi:circadian clock protein KaiB
MSEATRKSAHGLAPVGHYRLQLYVAGPAPRSVAALRNLEHVCAEYLPGQHDIEIIDLMKHPHLAKADNILAVPTLVRSEPGPVRKIIGNLSNPARVISGLDLGAAEPFARRKGGAHV